MHGFFRGIWLGIICHVFLAETIQRVHKYLHLLIEIKCIPCTSNSVSSSLCLYIGLFSSVCYYLMVLQYHHEMIDN